jgi:hypothetical protein
VDIAVMVTESARSALKMEHHLMCNCVQRMILVRLVRCEIVAGECNLSHTEEQDKTKT